MSETIIAISVFGVVEVACIIGLIVTHFREKKIEKETGKKPTHYSAVGNWLCGRRR